MSVMLVILNPALFKARTADSRPGPGPLIHTSKFFIPNSWTISPTREAATCAAKGVLLRDPRNPLLPAVVQASAFPWRSEMVIMVLLKDACTCATPSVTVRLIFFLVLTLLLTITLILPHARLREHPHLRIGRRGPFRVRAFVFVRWPRTGSPRR